MEAGARHADGHARELAGGECPRFARRIRDGQGIAFRETGGLREAQLQAGHILPVAVVPFRSCTAFVGMQRFREPALDVAACKRPLVGVASLVRRDRHALHAVKGGGVDVGQAVRQADFLQRAVRKRARADLRHALRHDDRAQGAIAAECLLLNHLQRRRQGQRGRHRRRAEAHQQKKNAERQFSKLSFHIDSPRIGRWYVNFTYIYYI